MIMKAILLALALVVLFGCQEEQTNGVVEFSPDEIHITHAYDSVTTEIFVIRNITPKDGFDWTATNIVVEIETGLVPLITSSNGQFEIRFSTNTNAGPFWTDEDFAINDRMTEALRQIIEDKERIQSDNKKLIQAAETLLGNITNTVERLASSGDFCRIKGHSWSRHQHLTLEYTEGKSDCRQCKLCGAHQTLFIKEEWR